MSLSLSHWYPGSGVVLDCIDSSSLHPYLLLSDFVYVYLVYNLGLLDLTCITLATFYGASANSAEPDQKAASDHVLHCLLT